MRHLLAPLTADSAWGQFETMILDGPDDPRLPTCDACVVQRVAVSSVQAAENLITLTRSKGIALFVDNDDAFNLLPEHAEGEAAMRRLMAAAAETWFSTQPLLGLYGPIKPGTYRAFAEFAPEGTYTVVSFTVTVQ